MIQGTRGGIGKSWVTTGFARYAWKHAGFKTATLKPQAIDDRVEWHDGHPYPHSVLTAIQAAGYQITPHCCPVVLIPTKRSVVPVDNLAADEEFHVYVMGKSMGVHRLTQYYHLAEPRVAIQEAISYLRSNSECMVIEGAGCPVEFNNSWDMSNMTTARLADARVYVVGDASTGGVFTSIVGVVASLAQEDRCFVKGTMIVKVPSRKQLAWIQDGFARLATDTGVPVLGAVPLIEADDSGVCATAVGQLSRSFRRWPTNLNATVPSRTHPAWLS